MIDTRKNARTLTWPADPFDAVYYKLNTTGKKLERHSLCVEI